MEVLLHAGRLVMADLLQNDDGAPRRCSSNGVPERGRVRVMPPAVLLLKIVSLPPSILAVLRPGRHPHDYPSRGLGLLNRVREGPARSGFVLTWGFLNFFWLTLLRRPVMSGALSLVLIVVLILLSQFKHSITNMTVTFADVLIVDVDTIRFLLTIIPGLAWKVGLAVALAIPVLVLLWRLDPFRVRRLAALAGCMVCFCALTALSLAEPTDREDEFDLHQYVSKFARSGAVSVVDLITKGVLEADAGCRPSSTPRMPNPAGRLASCRTS